MFFVIHLSVAYVHSRISSPANSSSSSINVFETSVGKFEHTLMWVKEVHNQLHYVFWQYLQQPILVGLAFIPPQGYSESTLLHSL